VTRAFGNLANEMSTAGYSDAEAEAIRAEVAHYAAVRDEVKLGAGEDVDFKQYEAGMRFLLDTYIQADASEVVADFKDTGLIQLIVEQGVGAFDKLPAGIKKDPEAVAETITNNMRKVIIDERAMNPKYYDKTSMSSVCRSSQASPGSWYMRATCSPAARRWRMTAMTWRLAAAFCFRAQVGSRSRPARISARVITG
jgi:hypothetical protein